MTARIRVKVRRVSLVKTKINAPFPSRVEADNFLTVTKANGVYTFGVDYTKLAEVGITDPSAVKIAVLDQSGNVYKLVSAADIAAVNLDPDLQAIAALTGEGILERTGDDTWTLRAAPTGALVGTTDTQTLTNKTYNGNTWTAGTGVLTLGAGKTATISNTLTFTGADASSVAFGAGGTVAYTANKLSAFAATTSLELKGIISDETGSGALVFANTPTLITPVLGAATATSINGAALDNNAWATTTPTVSASGGAITATCTLAYKTIGKTVLYEGTITVTSTAVVTGDVRITGVPFTSKNFAPCVAYEDVNTGKMAAGAFYTTGSIALRFYDGSFPGATGNRIRFSGTCEIA